MHLALASGITSWPVATASRLTQRQRTLLCVFTAALVVIALSLSALDPWKPIIEQLDPANQRFLGRPASDSAFLPQLSWPVPDSLDSSSSPPLARQPQRPISPGVPPDPLELPGWREGTKWVTNDPAVQLHHWLQLIIDGQGTGTDTDLEWARDKTVLLLGDSVLRGWVYHLCDDLVHGHKNRVTFSADADVDEKNEGWECVIPSTGTRFINGFVYGMTDYSKHPPSSPLISKDWPVGPWAIEDRIPAIMEQYSDYNVHMVVLNSGAWDMKFMYRRDVFEGRRSDNIDPWELDELGERLRQCMRMIAAAWPFSKMAFLQTQPFDTDDVLNRWIWAQNLTQHGGHDWGVDFGDFITETQSVESLSEKLPPMFTRRRVSQLATTYRRIAAEEGWDGLDLWKIAAASEPDEFYPIADPVHPAVSSIHIILDFALERLWRWESWLV